MKKRWATQAENQVGFFALDFVPPSVINIWRASVSNAHVQEIQDRNITSKIDLTPKNKQIFLLHFIVDCHDNRSEEAAPEKFENPALFQRLGLPSAFIRYERRELSENASQTGGI